MKTPEHRRNRLVIRSADVFGVYLIHLDPERVVDQWRVNVKFQDLKDAIEAYETECRSR